ncbi:uncharacterized protein [Littorina saxatilis]|uniref:UspA domain-containing protein n=1 Tax=Littorina saxatilis TaxID=31220 RepID=A0AAN9GCL7_9CAEN
MAERKVFIAVDGSKPADGAFNWYLDNVNRPGDMVYLVHSAEYNINMGMPGMAADVNAISKTMKEEDDRIGNLTGNYIENLKKRSIQAKMVTLKGQKPGEAIVKAASEEQASMIIMGSRGLGKVRRTLMGSVSEYVTHHAPPNCAIIILRTS